MSLAISNEPVPLEADSDGVIRVGGTRVTLDTVASSFKDGATPEEIACRYPSVRLADIYSVIGYYLKNAEAVETYLEQRRNLSRQVRRRNEERFNFHCIRERLLSRG